MRHAAVVSMFILVAAGAVAAPGPRDGPGQGLDRDSRALNNEIAAILDQSSQAQLGTMTVGDLVRLQGQISIAIQKEEYIRNVRTASFFLPGLGQFRTGDTTNGALFLAGDVAVAAGTLLGAYFLLPSNVQFASLDYLNTPLSSIRSTWESNTLADYAPSFAAAVGGMAVEMILRWASARNAESDARDAVASGRVTFQPRLVPLLGPVGPDGRMGMGLRLRW